jgi:hypothetical protein
VVTDFVSAWDIIQIYKLLFTGHPLDALKKLTAGVGNTAISAFEAGLIFGSVAGGWVNPIGVHDGDRLDPGLGGLGAGRRRAGDSLAQWGLRLRVQPDHIHFGIGPESLQPLSQQEGSACVRPI